jgi:hypothetical protein
MKKRYLLIFTIVLNLNSCKKQNEIIHTTTCNIYIYDYYFHNPIEHYKVYFYKVHTFDFGNHVEIKDTIYTDSNGLIKYNFIHDIDTFYYFQGYGNNIYPDLYTGTDGFDLSSKSYNFALKKYIVLKINMINQTKNFKNVWFELSQSSSYYKGGTYQGLFQDRYLFFTKIIPDDSLKIAPHFFNDDYWVNVKDTNITIWINKIDTMVYSLKN